MQYYLNHAPINFFFKHAPRDFVVDEIPLYAFTGEGEHLVLHVRKKSLSTWEMISKIANYLGINGREIGYAGLKDKHALTTQYISVHKRFETKIDAMSIEGVKVLNKVYHNNKIKTGHLKGNHFFIRLKKVNKVDAKKIKEALKIIKTEGMPNYFGFQRFGNDGDNYEKGAEIAAGRLKEKNKKLEKLYLNAYQSHLFNGWLDQRMINARLVEKRFGPLDLLEGDVCMHYPYGRAFVIEDREREYTRLQTHDTVIGGLIPGKRAMRAEGAARLVEAAFDKPVPLSGERRFSWVYPESIESEYKAEEGWMELHFSLPKGSYATVLLEQIAKQNLNTTR